MGAAEITRFLTSLAVEGKVAASTQNQALSAPPVSVYTHLLNMGPGAVRSPADRVFPS
jgi:hypothetical protein